MQNNTAACLRKNKISAATSIKNANTHVCGPSHALADCRDQKKLESSAFKLKAAPFGILPLCTAQNTAPYLRKFAPIFSRAAAASTPKNKECARARVCVCMCVCICMGVRWVESDASTTLSWKWRQCAIFSARSVRAIFSSSFFVSYNQIPAFLQWRGLSFSAECQGYRGCGLLRAVELLVGGHSGVYLSDWKSYRVVCSAKLLRCANVIYYNVIGKRK